MNLFGPSNKLMPVAPVVVAGLPHEVGCHGNGTVGYYFDQSCFVLLNYTPEPPPKVKLLIKTARKGRVTLGTIFYILSFSK